MFLSQQSQPAVPGHDMGESIEILALGLDFTGPLRRVIKDQRNATSLGFS